LVTDGTVTPLRERDKALALATMNTLVEARAMVARCVIHTLAEQALLSSPLAAPANPAPKKKRSHT